MTSVAIAACRTQVRSFRFRRVVKTATEGCGSIACQDKRVPIDVGSSWVMRRLGGSSEARLVAGLARESNLTYESVDQHNRHEIRLPRRNPLPNLTANRQGHASKHTQFGSPKPKIRSCIHQTQPTLPRLQHLAIRPMTFASITTLNKPSPRTHQPSPRMLRGSHSQTNSAMTTPHAS